MLAITPASVLDVLAIGIYGIERNGEINSQYGNLLMRWRIIPQLMAVGVMVLLFYLNQG
jgi:hypothetical protein